MTKKEELPQYSRRIVALREGLDLSQKKLGTLVGVTDAAITMWETGKRFPRGKNLTKLATALKVSPSYIIDETTPGIERTLPNPRSNAQLIIDIQAHLTALDEDQLRNILKLAAGYSGLPLHGNKIAKIK